MTHQSILRRARLLDAARHLATALAVAAACGATAVAAAAQAGGSVGGRVLAAEDGRPLPLAVVTVGDPPRQVFTAEDGSFVLADVPPGRQRIRVEQVGRVSVDTAAVVPLAAPLTIRLGALSVALEGVQVSASPGECVRGGFTDAASVPQMVSVMEELRKNAERLRLLTQRFPFSARWERTREMVGSGGQVENAHTDTTTVSSSERHPYEVGRVLVDNGGGRYDLNMPGVVSITQDEFQRTHCFRYSGVRTIDGRRLYAVEFIPTRDVGGTDVTGTLYVDADGFLLRRSEFHVIGLPASLAYRTLDVVTTYREVRPALPVVATLDFTQQLRNSKLQVEQRRLLDLHFTGAVPGAEQTPAPRGDFPPL
jgi:hypothetical protein